MKTRTFIAITEVDGACEYKQVSFDIDALIEKYGPETTIASVPELFLILGYEEKDIADDMITIEDVEELYPPDDDEQALPELGTLAEEIADMSPGVAVTIGNKDETFHLIPIDIS